MFCPQCKAEYRVGFVRCSTCDVELVDQLLPVADPPIKLGFEDLIRTSLLCAGTRTGLMQTLQELHWTWLELIP